MAANEEIDNLIARHPDWKGATLATLRKIILETNPEIIETWKWMGSPVWELDGIICVGNIFKNKVKLVFANGAILKDEHKLFNADLTGNQRRAIEYFENNKIDADTLKNLINEAISYNSLKNKK
jgi:hypothetical protein